MRMRTRQLLLGGKGQQPRNQSTNRGFFFSSSGDTQSRWFRRVGNVMTKTKTEKRPVKLCSCDQNPNHLPAPAGFCSASLFQAGWSYLGSENNTGERSVVRLHDGAVVGLWSVFLDFTVSLTIINIHTTNNAAFLLSKLRFASHQVC